MNKNKRYEEAVKLVKQYDKIGTSLIQRHFSIRHKEAEKLLDQLEKEGVLGHAEGFKPREVLVKKQS